VRRLLRFHWDRIEATLVDQRYDKTVGGDPPLRRYEYMVEVPGLDGEPVRLTFKEYVVKVDPPPVGERVGLRVNRKRTKAMFDLQDPRVNRSLKTAAQVDAQRAADKARFREKLNEQG
jgi:hypothetical protein